MKDNFHHKAEIGISISNPLPIYIQEMEVNIYPDDDGRVMESQKFNYTKFCWLIILILLYPLVLIFGIFIAGCVAYYFPNCEGIGFWAGIIGAEFIIGGWLLVELLRDKYIYMKWIIKHYKQKENE
jgi:hypothetical protein